MGTQQVSTPQVATRTMPERSPSIGSIVERDEARLNAAWEAERRTRILRPMRTRQVLGARRLVDYAFYGVYALLGVRLLLSLVAADPANKTVQLARTVTSWLYLPFTRIMPIPPIEEDYTFGVSLAVAILIIMMVHVAVHGMFSVAARRHAEY